MFGQVYIILRLILAFVLGGLIGLEREFHGRAAGLRTHILVCMGSSLIMLTSMYIFNVYQGATNIDPARIAAGVVTGIGFLGAGTILRFRASVRGLTTAASLWAVAAIGLAVGSGFYLGAYTTSALVLIVLFFLTKLEKAFVRKDWYKILCIETKSDIRYLQDIRSILSDYKVEIRDFEIKKRPDSDNVIVELNLKLMTDRQDDQIISNIMQIRGVERAGWQEM